MADRTERFLRAYDPHDGRTLWTRSVEGDIPFLPMAVAHSGDVFLRTSDALVALAPDGSVRWRFAPGGRGGWTPPLADVDGNVYVVFGDAVHSLTAEGARRWEITVPGARDLFIAAPGVLYVTTSATATTSASTATPATPLPSARSMRSAPSLVAIGSSPAQ
jgi:outer membrane protein assembly factor BamB